MEMHIPGNPLAGATPLKTEAGIDPQSSASVLSFDRANCGPPSGRPVICCAPSLDPSAGLQAHRLGSWASDSFLLASSVQPGTGTAAFVPCISYFEGTPSLSTDGSIAEGGGQPLHFVL